MNCRDYKLTIYYNGTEIRKDTGCVGDQHTYTTSTTLPPDTTYAWYIDSVRPPSPLVSTNASYTYIFGAENHELYLVATSASAGCSIQVTVKETTVVCNPVCENNCSKETVSFQAGVLSNLVDNFGNSHLIPNGFSFECAKTSTVNDKVTKWIKAMLKSQPNCHNADINVAWTFNKTGSNCITLVITNSPIKFTSITVGGKTYNFNTSLC